jgi:hypothetical protein
LIRQGADVRAGVPGGTVRRGLSVLGVIGLTWTFVHGLLTVVALTSGPTAGTTAEVLRLTAASSPILAVLSFCAAALAFSGRTAARRPGLAGATFLTLALVCAVALTGCTFLLLRHAAWWGLWWPVLNAPLIAALAVCRRVFRSAQRGG